MSFWSTVGDIGKKIVQGLSFLTPDGGSSAYTSAKTNQSLVNSVEKASNKVQGSVERFGETLNPNMAQSFSDVGDLFNSAASSVSNAASKVADAIGAVSPSVSPNGTGSNMNSGVTAAADPVVKSEDFYRDAPLAKAFGMDDFIAYQEALSNTAHQREVKDLQAAGLNPVLSASYGGAGSFGVAAPAASGGSSGSSSGVSSAKGMAYYLTELATGNNKKAEAAQGIWDVVSSLFSKE